MLSAKNVVNERTKLKHLLLDTSSLGSLKYLAEVLSSSIIKVKAISIVRHFFRNFYKICSYRLELKRKRI